MPAALGVQDFEISMIKHFLGEKYRVVVIFTKSDLASTRKLEELKAVAQREVGTSAPNVAVCSVSEELAVGRTKQFGVEHVIRQIDEGIWLSIIQRLPARCVTLICNEIEKWRQMMVGFVDEKTTIFNNKEVIGDFNRNTKTFWNNMKDKRREEIINCETRTTVVVFNKFDKQLNYSAARIHGIPLQFDSQAEEPIMPPDCLLRREEMGGTVPFIPSVHI